METPFLPLFHGVFGEDPLELPSTWGGWLGPRWPIEYAGPCMKNEF